MSRVAVLLVAALAGAPALGADEHPPAPSPERREAPKQATLDELFARLAAAGDEAEAKGIAGLIERRWSRSGSDTADLLLSRALQAMRTKDNALAVELLDRLIALQPGWAEAWNRRATAFVLLDDPAAASADLRQAIAREPRHYEAWATLGQLYLAGGDNKRALEAFRHALAIHPFLPSLQAVVDRLAPEVEGRDL